jgi:hypothetical protein
MLAARVASRVRSFATQVPDREGWLEKLVVRSSMPQVPLSTPFPGVKVPTEYVAQPIAFRCCLDSHGSSRQVHSFVCLATAPTQR